MSEALLAHLINDAVSGAIRDAWRYWAALLGLTLLFSIGGTFLGAYFKRRGENYATRADFKTLVDQVKTTTTAVEGVKAEISYADWRTREWNTLRRLKLEELVEALETAATQLNDREDRHFWNFDPFEEARISSDPIEAPAVGRLLMLQILYFPELDASVRKFNLAHRSHVVLLLSSRGALIEAATTCGGDRAAFQSKRLAALSEYKGKFGPMHKDIIEASQEVRNEAQKLMTKIAAPISDADG